MPMRPMIIIMLAVVVIMVVLLIVGIGRDPIDIDEVLAYADPITEDMLLAMNEEDYAAFAEHFGDDMRETMSEEVFEEVIIGRIQATIGEFISKAFLRARRQDDGITVIYEADFSDEPGIVTVHVSFREIEGPVYVSDLLFDSPKLRQLG